MSNYITEQIQDSFSEIKEWDSFLLLCQNKNVIRDDWLLKLKSKINEMVIKSLPDEWGFVSLNLWDWRWYIKEYEATSLCLLQQGVTFNLWSNRNFFDTKKTFDLLQLNKYSLLKSAFDRIDDVFDENSEYRFRETGNYYFDNETSSGNISLDKFAWYANYKTNELANQIIEKVNKFINNPDITKIFKEINELSKIKDN